MNIQVQIRQYDKPIAVETGETILAAALRQGVPYPHGCQSGNCGACKSHLLSGDVELSPYSEFALSEQERGNGLILACRAVPSQDSTVAWLEADESIVHPVRHLQCRVARIEAATHDIRRLWLTVESGGPFVFSAGQFAKLTFQGQPARDYSMANRPGQPQLEFHIRHLPGGKTSAFVASTLKVGDPVQVEGPFGASYLRELHSGPILAVAGGSGLAPILSIVETALAKGLLQPIHLYFGIRDERDVYHQQRLSELADRHANFSAHIVLSEPAQETSRPTGFVHLLVRQHHADFDGCKAYLAGPPPMVEAATEMFTAGGMGAGDIHADAFYTEAEKAELETII
ncbi:MAG: NADH:ubiquinone reductase (Na(+)-transporting) subunit F [Alphaproteobacteria bacterium]